MKEVKDFSLFDSPSTEETLDKKAKHELRQALKEGSYIILKPTRIVNRGRGDFEGSYTLIGSYKGSHIEVYIDEEDFLLDQFESFDTNRKTYLMSHLGTTYPLLIKKYKAPYFYASRVLAAREYEEYRYFSNDKHERYKTGSIVNAKVVSVHERFLIAEVGGVEVALKNKDLSFSPLPDLRMIYKTGMVLKVKITELELDFKTKRVTKLKVDRREIEGKRIDKILPSYHVGSYVTGRVTINLSGGPIVYIGNGLSVFARMGSNYARPQVGNEVIVELLRIDYESKKLYGVLRSKSLLKNFDNL